MKIDFTVNNQEIDKIYKKLEKIYRDIDSKEFINDIAGDAAKLVVKVAKSNVFDNAKPVNRYQKGTDQKKGKGKGKVIATYYPGNLRRSIRVLRFRRAKSLSIGPKFVKGATTGAFRGARVDGWYAHFVEYGAGGRIGMSFGFMRRAWISTERRVEIMILTNLKKWLDKYNKRG